MFIYDLPEKEINQNIDELLEKSFESSLYDAKNFDKYSPIYAFTTENIRGYFTKIDMKDKVILTVSGSGDHIINSFFCDAKEVNSFDINILSAFFCELKIAALKYFSYDEFLRFFMREELNGEGINYNAMNYEKYKILRVELSRMCKNFFDKLYSINEHDGCYIRNSKLFNNKYDINKVKMISNLYLQSNDAYEAAKEKIKGKNITWANIDVRNLNSIFENKKVFDIILLSNISDYSQKMFVMHWDYISKFVDYAIKPLLTLLKQHGKICAAYIYDEGIKQNYQYHSQIDNPVLREQAFNSTNVSWKQEHFGSVINGKRDAVIILG